MSEYIKVKDNQDLVRDIKSSALLNTDTLALKAYKQKKIKELQLENIFKEHEELKKDINDIKDLLKELLGRNR